VNRRAALVLAGAVLAAAVAPVAAADQPATMRVDYFHTGGQGAEIYSVERIVVEPLPWPGSLERAVDDTNLGTYRFEVRDNAGKLLYSRGFDSIYAEWATTAEAGTTHRTFEDSLRFPAPAGEAATARDRAQWRPARQGGRAADRRRLHGG
jgi:hypothetical protein